jgi:hypothetical protein
VILRKLKAAPQIKRFMTQISLSMQYDSNVVLESEPFEITDKEDVRGVVTGTVIYRIYHHEKSNVNTFLNFYQSYHLSGMEETSAFNLTGLRAGINYKRNFGVRELTFGISPGVYFIKGDREITGRKTDFNLFSYSCRVFAYVIYPISNYGSLKAVYSFIPTFYDEQTLGIKENLRLYGRDNLGNELLIIYLLPKVLRNLDVYAGGRFRFEEAEGRNFDLYAPAAILRFRLALRYGLNFQLFASYEWENHYNDASPPSRIDDVMMMKATVSKRIGERFNLSFGYDFVGNRSTEKEFDYDRWIATVTFIWRI